MNETLKLMVIVQTLVRCLPDDVKSQVAVNLAQVISQARFLKPEGVSLEYMQDIREAAEALLLLAQPQRPSSSEPQPQP